MYQQLFLMLLPNCTCRNHKYFLRSCTRVLWGFFWSAEFEVLSMTHPCAFLRAQAPCSWWGTVLQGAWEEPGAVHSPSQERAAAASCDAHPELPQPLLSWPSVLGTKHRARDNWKFACVSSFKWDNYSFTPHRKLLLCCGSSMNSELLLGCCTLAVTV